MKGHIFEFRNCSGIQFRERSYFPSLELFRNWILWNVIFAEVIFLGLINEPGETSYGKIEVQAQYGDSNTTTASDWYHRKPYFPEVFTRVKFTNCSGIIFYEIFSHLGTVIGFSFKLRNCSGIGFCDRSYFQISELFRNWILWIVIFAEVIICGTPERTRGDVLWKNRSPGTIRRQ